MKTMPPVENVVTHHLDVVDRHAEDGRLYSESEADFLL